MTIYKSSGVDTKLADEFIKDLNIEGFGAVIELPTNKIVLSTDGVGTKILVAEAQNKFDTIGIDLVAMCTNDLLCQGAKPHSYLDYYATGKINIKKVIERIKYFNFSLVKNKEPKEHDLLVLKAVGPKDIWPCHLSIHVGYGKVLLQTSKKKSGLVDYKPIVEKNLLMIFRPNFV